MALFQFSTSISTTVSELAEKLTSWQDNGASISDIAISNINDISFLINDKYCNVKYNISSSQNANYFWFLCDSVGYETLIVLCDSPIVNENGYKGSLGNALYNAIYFLHNGRLVRNPQIDEPICSQFNIPNGPVVESSDDRVIFTRCTFNNGVNIEIGSSEITDRLYISTNLVSAGFLTEIAGSGQKFINIGGIFYLPYNNVILSLSKYKKRNVLKNAEIELWAGCYEDNEKIYDKKNNVFYKNTYNNIKIVPDGNMEMGYIDLDAGDRLLLTSKEPFYNKTIYLVAYDTGIESFDPQGRGTEVGYMKKIITSGITFRDVATDKISFYPEMFSLNKMSEWSSSSSFKNEWGYALMNYKSQNWNNISPKPVYFNYSLLSKQDNYFFLHYPEAYEAVWVFKDIKVKKNIYVLKSPVVKNGEYSAFINNLKIEKSASYFIESYKPDSYNKADYFLIIGGRQGADSSFVNPIAFPTEEKAFSHNYIRNTSELKIDYFGIIEESQSDEEIQKNIQKLAKIFEVDLEEPS